MLHHRLVALGSGPVSSTALLFCHATGFNLGVFAPLEQHLDSVCSAAGQTVHCLSVDLTGHGMSYKRAEGVDGSDWGSFGVADVADALKLLPDGVTSVCGVGHSMGGAALCLADVHGVATFSRLVLFEPVIFPPAAFKSGGNRLSKLTAKRRFCFPDSPTAVQYFRTKDLFKDWHPAAMDGYVECGLMPAAERYGDDTPPEQELLDMSPEERVLTLCCDRRFESQVFAGSHSAWDHTPSMTTDRTVLVWGEDTDFGKPYIDPSDLFNHVLHDRIPRSDVVAMPGCGHMGPMERPTDFGNIIAKELGLSAVNDAPKSRL